MENGIQQQFSTAAVGIQRPQEQLRAVVFMFCTRCFLRSPFRRFWKVLRHLYSEGRSVKQTLRYQAMIDPKFAKYLSPLLSCNMFSQKYPHCALPPPTPTAPHVMAFILWQLCLVKGTLTEKSRTLGSALSRSFTQFCDLVTMPLSLGLSFHIYKIRRVGRDLRIPFL